MRQHGERGDGDGTSPLRSRCRCHSHPSQSPGDEVRSDQSQLPVARGLWIGGLLGFFVFLGVWNGAQVTDDALCMIDPSGCGSLGVKNATADTLGTWGMVICGALFLFGLLRAKGFKDLLIERNARELGEQEASHRESRCAAGQRALKRDQSRCRECDSTQVVAAYYSADPSVSATLRPDELESEERMISLCEFHGSGRRRVDS